jgi:16S rRNA (uracil1498-N3)-methyltransferase
MHRFLHPETLKEEAEVLLSAEESHHLAKVVRIRDGEEIELVNGQGSIARARVVNASAKSCRVQILSVRLEKNRSIIHLAFGIPKSAALEFILRRCTELGVASFTPLVTHYSLRPHAFNESRWHKILAEVCKQCEEAYFPELLPPITLDEWMKHRSTKRPIIFCHENEREAELTVPRGTEGVDLLVGSEGGWEAEETERLLNQGVIPFGLGKNRLRAETAALVATTLVKQRLGEL